MQTPIRPAAAISPPISATFPVKPAHFWTVFSEALRTDYSDPQKQVRDKYDHAKPWTLYISELTESLSGKFSCIADREYWPRIDVSYFDKAGKEWAEWALEVAIELENNENWIEELSKLLMVNAGLKVLIAYENSRERIMELLSEFTRIHASRKYRTSNCGWLFIFGPRQIDAIEGAIHDFVAFTFNGTEIIEITGDRHTLL